MSRTKSPAQLIKAGISRLKKLYPSLTQLAMDDLSQDAWLYALEKQGQASLPSLLRGYLHRRVQFYLPDTLSIEGSGWDYAIDSINPYEVLEWKEEARLLIEALSERLSPRERDVVLMKLGVMTGQPLSLEQVGDFFNCTQERSRQLLARGIRRLKNCPSIQRQEWQSLKGERDFPSRPYILEAEFPELIGSLLPKEFQPQDLRDYFERIEIKKFKMKQRFGALEEKRAAEAQKKTSRRKHDEKWDEFTSSYRLQEASRLEAFKAEQDAFKGVVNPLVVTHNCPDEIIDFFLKYTPNLDKCSKEGFYLIVISPTDCKYIIANYGLRFQSTDSCNLRLSLEAWNEALTPIHIKNIVLVPGYSRVIRLQTLLSINSPVLQLNTAHNATT